MQKSMDIDTYTLRRKKGSSHLREIFSTKNVQTSTRNINKFSENLDIVVFGDQSKFLNSLWTCRFFSNKEKTFLFKFHNNTLGYNCAVAHFVRGHSPYCTFCELVRVQEQNRESPLHLFFDCETISNMIDNIFKRSTNNQDFVFSRERILHLVREAGVWTRKK